MDKIEILGVRVSNISFEQALNATISYIERGGKHYIVTPNPEFIVRAASDKTFRDILNNADIALPDGFGLRLANTKLSHTVTGTDLMEALCRVCSEKGFTVGFLGGKDNIAIRLAECLKKKYPGLRVNFAASGGVIDSSGEQREKILVPKTDILFVAFGHVKQEKWIAKNLPNLPVSVAMGVGGAFDYLSGTVPRAPRIIRKLGLEWFFRLIIEPWRIKRQTNLLKFIWQVMVH